MERWFSKNVFTHISMDGSSSLNVPTHETKDFHRTYINQVKHGKKLYLVEKRTKLFRFFMDIDYISDSKLTREEIIEIVDKVHACIPGRCLIAVSKSCPKDDKIKSGIHVHWPELIVTSKKALELRKKVQEDILPFVDESVYKGSGLRMLWSYKKDDGPPYIPFFDVSSRTYLDHNPTQELLELYSIRTEYDELLGDTSSSCECTDLERFLRDNFKGQENIEIKKLKDEPKKLIIQTNSRYCENKRDLHKSNHVYFVIDKKNYTVFQKCFDEDCKKFESRRRRLPPTIKEIISSNTNVRYSFWENSEET